jgi:hypothetical protein
MPVGKRVVEPRNSTGMSLCPKEPSAGMQIILKTAIFTARIQ